jgi:hypothetical protein
MGKERWAYLVAGVFTASTESQSSEDDESSVQELAAGHPLCSTKKTELQYMRTMLVQMESLSDGDSSGITCMS